MDLRVAGKYKIIKKIGSGAFGEIYQGIFDYINFKNNLNQKLY